jgi:hypothetical protein
VRRDGRDLAPRGCLSDVCRSFRVAKPVRPRLQEKCIHRVGKLGAPSRKWRPLWPCRPQCTRMHLCQSVIRYAVSGEFAASPLGEVVYERPMGPPLSGSVDDIVRRAPTSGCRCGFRGISVQRHPSRYRPHILIGSVRTDQHGEISDGHFQARP